jgi:hypothetical protein
VQVLPSRNRVCGLQGYRYDAAAADEPGKDLFSEAQRQLRGLSAEGEEGNKAGKVYGPAAFHRLEMIMSRRYSFFRQAACLPEGGRAAVAEQIWRRFYEGIAL